MCTIAKSTVSTQNVELCRYQVSMYSNRKIAATVAVKLVQVGCIALVVFGKW